MIAKVLGKIRQFQLEDFRFTQYPKIQAKISAMKVLSSPSPSPLFLPQNLKFKKKENARPSHLLLLLLLLLHHHQGLSEEEAYKQSLKIEPRDPSEAVEKMLQLEDQLRQTVNELQVKRGKE